MPPKLKIGYLLDDTLDSTDGIQQYILTIGNWMIEHGHEVHYLVGETKRKDIKNVHSLAKNIRVKYNQNRLTIPLPANKSDIEELLAKLNLDIIHVQAPYSPLFAGRVIMAAKHPTKIIGTFHIVVSSRAENVGARALKLMSFRTLKKIDSMISVSTAAQDYAKKIFKVNSVVIPNAVNIKNFRREPKYSDVPHVVFLGRLVERKGCVWLLKATKELKDRGVSDYRMTIAGKGPLMEQLKAYAGANNLDNVNFIGYVSEDDKPGLLASADIAVFPSTGGESFGIVLIEAMASGSRVVLGGDNVGYNTVLGSHGKLTINPKNTKHFADSLQFFLKNSNARQECLAWQQKAVKQYDVDTVAQKVLKTYLSA